MRAYPYIAVLVLALILIGCGKTEQPPLTELRKNAPMKRVQVFEDGTVLVDGHVANPASLDDTFAELAEAHGVVFYYREDPDSALYPAARDLLDRMLDHELAIWLSLEPDFIDMSRPGTKTPNRAG